MTIRRGAANNDLIRLRNQRHSQLYSPHQTPFSPLVGTHIYPYNCYFTMNSATITPFFILSLVVAILVQGAVAHYGGESGGYIRGHHHNHTWNHTHNHSWWNHSWWHHNHSHHFNHSHHNHTHNHSEYGRFHEGPGGHHGGFGGGGFGRGGHE